MIACICSYFNYNGNKLRRELYERFRENFNHPIITAEVALREIDFCISDSHKILANENNILWQKERTFNIILETLPPEYDKIVWLDTDLKFHNPDWLDEMDKKLDEHLMVQGFENVFETEGSNNVLNCRGYGKNVYDYEISTNTKNNPIKYIDEHFALGLVWGINRSYIPEGFYDRHILGSNDAMQIIGVMGDFLNSQLVGCCTPNIVLDFLDYSERQPIKDTYSIGYCEGDLEHFYHGDKLDRGYIEREIILDNYKFNPKLLEIDEQNGLYKLPSQYKELQEEIRDYFQDRSDTTKK